MDTAEQHVVTEAMMDAAEKIKGVLDEAGDVGLSVDILFGLAISYILDHSNGNWSVAESYVSTVMLNWKTFVKTAPGIMKAKAFVGSETNDSGDEQP